MEKTAEYKVKCPCCGEITTPEVDEAGTRYPCCGNEFPDAPPEEFLIPVKEDKMVRKIVTHTRPGHTDDILAVGLLSQKYPDAEIVFVHPQSPELEELKERDDVILVDVGGEYNPARKNYDHHQDTEVPSSLMLVLKHEFPEYLKAIKSLELWRESLEFIDYKDRFGPKKAEEITGINPKGGFILEEIIKEFGDTPEGIRAVGKTLTNRLEKTVEILRKFENGLEEVEIEEINGLKVAIDREGIPTGYIVEKFFPDLIIQRNNRDPEHTSVIKNIEGEKADEIDLTVLSDEAIFVHPTRFLVVLNRPIEEVAGEVEEIASRVYNSPKGPEL